MAGAGLFIVGMVAGVFADPYLPAALSNTQKGYTAGFTAARARVENSSIGGMFKSPTEVHMVVGTVTAVNGNAISIHVNSSNPFDDPALLNRTVLIGTSTKVTKISTTIDTKNKKIPMSVTYATSTPAAILVGSYIAAIATENVASQKEFTASEIQILK